MHAKLQALKQSSRAVQALDQGGMQRGGAGGAERSSSAALCLNETSGEGAGRYSGIGRVGVERGLATLNGS